MNEEMLKELDEEMLRRLKDHFDKINNCKCEPITGLPTSNNNERIENV